MPPTPRRGGDEGWDSCVGVGVGVGLGVGVSKSGLTVCWHEAKGGNTHKRMRRKYARTFAGPDNVSYNVFTVWVCLVPAGTSNLCGPGIYSQRGVGLRVILP